MCNGIRCNEKYENFCFKWDRGWGMSGGDIVCVCVQVSDRRRVKKCSNKRNEGKIEIEINREIQNFLG